MYRCPGSHGDTGLVLNCKPFEPSQLTLLTWKWPGCLDVFAPAQLLCQLMSSNGPRSRHKCLTKYLIVLQPQAFCDALYARNSFSVPTSSTPTASRSRRPEFHFPKVGNPISQRSWKLELTAQPPAPRQRLIYLTPLWSIQNDLYLGPVRCFVTPDEKPTIAGTVTTPITTIISATSPPATVTSAATATPSSPTHIWYCVLIINWLALFQCKTWKSTFCICICKHRQHDDISK